MIREISYHDSREYLNKFQKEEKSYGVDWYDCEDKDATYIWWIESEVISENPLGFLSYKKMILTNSIDFVYIIKIYVLKTHRSENPILIEGERVSIILFKELDKKEVNILTLESACTELDVYYKNLGFSYNKEISGEFSKSIGTSEKIMYRRKEDILFTDAERNMFGEL